MILPKGIDDFETIITSGCYYIDKTDSLRVLLLDNEAKVAMFTRPRRFGKTTFLSTAASFLDIRKDSKELFKNLNIYKDKNIVDNWMNKYPVIYISFKDVTFSNSVSSKNKISSLISHIFESFSFLLDDELFQNYRRKFNIFLNEEAEDYTITESLLFLSELLFKHYKKKVIILIDEYDVPLASADANNYYEDMINIIRPLYSTTLKVNPYLEKAIITGCLRVSKESIFTGLNNLNGYSLTDSEYSSTFGFTKEEVSQILKEADLESRSDIVKDWYDGYRIGEERIYCPWDVIKYVSKAIIDKEALPENYWINTSSNEAVKKLIELYKDDVENDYIALIKEKSINKRILTDLTYGSLYSSPNNIWTLLFQTGYLTLKVKYVPNEDNELVIPNNEINSIFKDSIDSWFKEVVERTDNKNLMDAIWECDCKTMSILISDTLMESISYYDYSESFYHGFMVAILKSNDYKISSNMESGLGRADIILRDSKNKRVAIFELKKTSKQENMENDAKKALEQIEKRQYETTFSAYNTILKYGVLFYKKSALVCIEENKNI